MTFGETVVNVVTIIESSSSDFTAYTVPSGRYAIVNIKRAVLTAGDGDFEVGGVALGLPIVPNDNVIVYLRSGQTIFFDRGTNGVGAINATAIEFNLP